MGGPSSFKTFVYVFILWVCILVRKKSQVFFHTNHVIVRDLNLTNAPDIHLCRLDPALKFQCCRFYSTKRIWLRKTWRFTHFCNLMLNFLRNILCYHCFWLWSLFLTLSTGKLNMMNRTISFLFIFKQISKFFKPMFFNAKNCEHLARSIHVEQSLINKPKRFIFVHEMLSHLHQCATVGGIGLWDQSRSERPIVSPCWTEICIAVPHMLDAGCSRLGHFPDVEITKFYFCKHLNNSTSMKRRNACIIIFSFFNLSNTCPDCKWLVLVVVHRHFDLVLRIYQEKFITAFTSNFPTCLVQLPQRNQTCSHITNNELMTQKNFFTFNITHLKVCTLCHVFWACHLDSFASYDLLLWPLSTENRAGSKLASEQLSKIIHSSPNTFLTCISSSELSKNSTILTCLLEAGDAGEEGYDEGGVMWKILRTVAAFGCTGDCSPWAWRYTEDEEAPLLFWWERQCNWCLADSAHCSHPYVVGTLHSCCFALLSIFALSFLALRLNSFAVASATSFLAFTFRLSSTSSTKTTASTPWYVPTAFSFTFLPLALDASVGVGPSAVPLLASWIDFLTVSWLQLFDTRSKLMICSLTWM